jgi:Bacteriophage Sf6, terminase small subunit-like
MGRRSKYTPELAESVLSWIASGRSVRSWEAADPSRPRRESVMRWVVKDTDGFAERYREARRAFVEALADDLVDDAREARGKDMPGVQAQRLITDTTKWLLSRIHPDCADRLQLGGPLAGNATIVVTLPAKGQPVTIDGTATEIEQQLLEDGSEG